MRKTAIINLMLILSAVGVCFGWGDSVGINDEIQQFGVTWTFAQDCDQSGTDAYTCGQYANDDWWVVGPVDLWFTPESDEVGGRRMNGSMINPDPSDPITTGNQAGYDSSLVYYRANLNIAIDGAGDPWDAGNMLTVNTNSSIVSSISLDSINESDNHSVRFSSMSILTVVATPPAANSFRPSYCSVDKTSYFNESDLDYDLLGSVTPGGSVETPPSPALIAARMERPWIDHKNGWLGRGMHPTLAMPDYGRDMNIIISEASLIVQLDYTNEQKRDTLVNLCQFGIDCYGIVERGGINNWMPDGGHAAGRKWPILFAGIMMDESANNAMSAAMKDIGARSGDSGWEANGEPKSMATLLSEEYVWFGEDTQVFRVTAALISSDYPNDRASRGEAYCDPAYSYPYETDYDANDIDNPDWCMRGLDSSLWGLRTANSFFNGRRRTDGSTSDEDDEVEPCRWGMAYRWNQTSASWGGQVLAAHIMEATAGARTLYNYPVRYEYHDRFMAEALTTHGRYTYQRQWSSSVDGGNYWATDMWDIHRPNYGPIWPEGAGQPEAPEITDPNAISITDTTATLQATITDLGTQTVTAHGIRWHTSSPVGSNNEQDDGEAGSIGTFSQVDKGGFPPQTKIHYIGFAENSVKENITAEGTFITEPATQASNLRIEDVTETTLTLRWDRGSGHGVIAMIREGGAVDSEPVDDTIYFNPDYAYGAGDEIGTGNFVLYLAGGTNIPVSNLDPDTRYDFAIYEYSAGSGVGPNYKHEGDPLRGNQTTLAAPAAEVQYHIGRLNNRNLELVSLAEVNLFLRCNCHCNPRLLERIR